MFARLDSGDPDILHRSWPSGTRLTLRVGISVPAISLRAMPARLRGRCLEIVQLRAQCASTESFAASSGPRLSRFQSDAGEAALDLLIVALPRRACRTGGARRRIGCEPAGRKPIALDLGRGEAMVDAGAHVVAACGFMIASAMP